MKRYISILFLLFAAILFAKEAAVVPVDHEPVHHKVLDNESVCVFDVVVPPHAATLMHRHDRDYIFVTLGDSDISNERMGEKPVHLTLKDGEARYTRGGFEHIARNLAETPFHNLTIELKKPGSPLCGIDPAAACENADQAAIVRELFATEHLIVRLTTLEPGEQTPEHTHAYPHLAVAVDDLTFENHEAGKPPALVSMKKGQFVWVANIGITHFFKNVGKARARMLALEFK